MLRATTACNFSSLIWPDGSARAALASLLFGPPGLQSPNHRKNALNSRLSYFFCIFFCAPALSFFSDLLTSFLPLSDSSHLCLSNCPYCRKFHFQTSFDNRYFSWLTVQTGMLGVMSMAARCSTHPVMENLRGICTEQSLIN